MACDTDTTLPLSTLGYVSLIQDVASVLVGAAAVARCSPSSFFVSQWEDDRLVHEGYQRVDYFRVRLVVNYWASSASCSCVLLLLLRYLEAQLIDVVDGGSLFLRRVVAVENFPVRADDSHGYRARMLVSCLPLSL